MCLRFILVIIVVATAHCLHSQTIYRLKFRSPVADDTTIYDAFFSVSSNGTGFVRMRSQKTIIAMDILEQYPLGKDGLADTTRLLYETSSSVFISGNKKMNFPALKFWFDINTEGFPDPGGVSLNTDSVPVKFISSEFIRSQDLVKNKATVLNFFADTSVYFKNVFGPKSRGGVLTVEEKKNTRMFLIIVASTRDSTLMPNVMKDAWKMVDMFTDIGKNILGIRFFIDTIYGDTYNKPTVEMALNKLKPGKNDIVVFYYSGHGFTDRNYIDKDFPFLDLRDPNKRPRPDARTQTMNIQDIYDRIIAKGARFNLVLSDCCNDTIEARKAPGPKLPGQRGLTKANFENVKALFMNKTPVNLLMTAASKDERAIITPSYSSYFTNFFIESLKTYLSPEKPIPNWFQILGETQKQTKLFAERACCRQTPKLLLPR